MANPENLDAVVVGGGVVGLAVGRALARAGREVVVFETERTLGAHASSRNAEVIHAGLFYPRDSCKAKLCVRGKRLLYEYLLEHGVRHRRIGKLVVATRDEETNALEAIVANAESAGVTDLSELDAREVHALEPRVLASRALLSPSSGIVDGHGLIAALRAEIEQLGGHVTTLTPVLGGRVLSSGFALECGGSSAFSVHCELLVNAAGLFAQALSRRIEGIPPGTIPGSYYSKGYFFEYAGPAPFSRLVYPVPGTAALGIHPTIDLSGRVRFGPDVNYVKEVDYAFDESRRAHFCAAIGHYFPTVACEKLLPGYAGIRPKLKPEGGGPQDFVVQGAESHGIDGLVQLYGIDTPGLTASLALAELVAEKLGCGSASQGPKLPKPPD